ncbi:hypothetical protein ACIQH9_20245 [Pseudarthrobacter oxydans]|uniref:hypothetical protein n=1 Tax=Pseudarthrobacter oxydans TaxID=1671 RepID=UPI0038249B4F
MADVESVGAPIVEGQRVEALTEDGPFITGTVDETALDHDIVWVRTASGERKMLHIIADNVRRS